MIKKNKKEKTYVPSPYTKEEREKKINKIKLQLMQIDMYHVLQQRHKDALNNFVNNGEEFSEEFDLPLYSRTLVFHLVNDKKKETYINLKFKKIRVPNDDNNPINKLNSIQEQLMEDDLER